MAIQSTAGYVNSLLKLNSMIEGATDKAKVSTKDIRTITAALQGIRNTSESIITKAKETKQLALINELHTRAGKNLAGMHKKIESQRSSSLFSMNNLTKAGKLNIVKTEIDQWSTTTRRVSDVHQRKVSQDLTLIYEQKDKLKEQKADLEAMLARAVDKKNTSAKSVITHEKESERLFNHLPRDIAAKVADCIATVGLKEFAKSALTKSKFLEFENSNGKKITIEIVGENAKTCRSIARHKEASKTAEKDYNLAERQATQHKETLATIEQQLQLVENALKKIDRLV